MAAFIVLIFAAFDGFLRPFIRDEANNFAAVMHLILFINYFCTIVIFADGGLGSEMDTPFSSSAIGLFVFILNVILGPVMAVMSLLVDDDFDLRGAASDSAWRIALKIGLSSRSIESMEGEEESVESDEETPADELPPMTVTFPPQSIATNFTGTASDEPPKTI